jgi:hypothetical protein
MRVTYVVRDIRSTCLRSPLHNDSPMLVTNFTLGYDFPR